MELALNVLESVRSYYKLAQSDSSRNGITIRKIILESVSGSAVRNAMQLWQLGDILGARKKTVYECSKVRLSIDEKEEMIPLVEKFARKAPEGESFISQEWKLKGVQFYEMKSEVIKGHHCMYKVYCHHCIYKVFILPAILFTSPDLTYFCNSNMTDGGPPSPNVCAHLTPWLGPP